MARSKKVPFGRIRNGDMFYDDNTLYRKRPRRMDHKFGYNAQAVDNDWVWQYFNDHELVEVPDEEEEETQKEN